LFIGYSLDDPDFRIICQIIRERLGQLSHVGYTIRVDENAQVIARYSRRNVRVINLPGRKEDYGLILQSAFEELRTFIRNNVLDVSIITRDELQAAVSLPKDTPSRVCFLSVPVGLYPFYKRVVSPILERHGYIPTIPEDVIAPGDSIAAKIEALLDLASLIIFDTGSGMNANILQSLANSTLRDKAIIVISESPLSLPMDARLLQNIIRAQNVFDDIDTIATSIELQVSRLADDFRETFQKEPQRLIDKEDYSSAIITSVNALEDAVRANMNVMQVSLPSKPIAMRSLLDIARPLLPLLAEYETQISEWLNLRDKVVHGKYRPSESEVTSLVNGIDRVISLLMDR